MYALILLVMVTLTVLFFRTVSVSVLQRTIRSYLVSATDENADKIVCVKDRQEADEIDPASILITHNGRSFAIDDDFMDVINDELKAIDRTSDDSLTAASAKIREAFEKFDIPADLKADVVKSYTKLFPKGKEGFVAVRSSATAEDLPDASFAGQQETYLNVHGEKDLYDKIDAVIKLLEDNFLELLQFTDLIGTGVVIKILSRLFPCIVEFHHDVNDLLLAHPREQFLHLRL